MTGNNRREKILNHLIHAIKPTSASKFSSMLGVSRQIIVGDIALLRAQGHHINATARGYIMYEDKDRFIAKIAVNHTFDMAYSELHSLVELGIYILDVSVEHPFYGELTGRLDIHNENDIERFLKQIETEEAPLLSSLTDGIHLHTISCPDKETYLKALKVLKDKEILIDNP